MGCSTALAQTQLAAACLHFATPSPPAAALRAQRVFISQGFKTSKRWGVIRMQGATRGQGIAGNAAAAAPCAAAGPSCAALQHRHGEGRLGGGKRRDTPDGGCSQVGKACCPGLQPCNRSAHKKLLLEISSELHGGGGRAVLTLRNTNMHITQHNSDVNQHNSHITQCM